MTEYQYTLKSGEVTYTLSVTGDADGYRGNYFCNVCNTTTPVARVYSSQADAMAKLQAIAYAQHHAPIHFIG